jgi:poly-gamma-glutamate capsule biosynthesis protein CapA/YwtB (metallophosphatase superfamily)
MTDAARNTYTLTLAGDTSFGENYQAEYAARGGVNILETRGYAYSLDRLRSFLLESDSVIANLETPLTDLAKSPFEGEKPFIHRADIEKTPRCLLDHNVRVVSLANNHVVDYGREGLKQTREALIRHGMSFFGAGLNTEEAAQAYRQDIVVGGETVRLAVFGAFESRRKYVMKYGFYAFPDSPGVSRLASPDLAQRIQRVKRNAPDTFVIVFPHWGENYYWRTPKQTRTAYELIDAGADLILGHGSHMLGEVESYAGRWIVYSLGNFVFNAEGKYSEAAPGFSYLARITLSGRALGLEARLRLYPIVSDNGSPSISLVSSIRQTLAGY